MSAPSSTFLASDAGVYDQLMGRWSRRWATRFLDFVGVTDGAVLDAGCGTGSLTAALLEHSGVRSVHGIDVSPAYATAAQKRYASPCATFEAGDACAIAAPDKSFDHALSLLVLQFVPQAERAITKM